MNHSASQFRVDAYTPTQKNIWDQFVSQAKNSTFLHRRDFMDYHSDRFTDASVMIWKGDKLVAVFPANKHEAKVYSHQGLTYGGLLLSPKIKTTDTLAVFSALLKHYNTSGVETIELKQIPHIYCKLPSDEISYLLFITQATRTRVDVSSTIDSTNRLKIQSNRTEGVKKAEKNRLLIKDDNDFENFWNYILIPNLRDRHNAQPVHSLDEIQKLAKAFPSNIKQYNVWKDDQIVAGATMFVTDKVAHVQYISANEDKQQLGSLDYLFFELITKIYATKPYFDFGISNQASGKQLNEGLLYWKECFGARAVAHEFYSVPTANYHNLETVLV